MPSRAINRRWPLSSAASAITNDPDYLEALKAAEARPNAQTMRRLLKVLTPYHDRGLGKEADRLWRKALKLLNHPRFGD